MSSVIVYRNECDGKRTIEPVYDIISRGGLAKPSRGSILAPKEMRLGLPRGSWSSMMIFRPNHIRERRGTKYFNVRKKSAIYDESVSYNGNELVE